MPAFSDSLSCIQISRSDFVICKDVAFDGNPLHSPVLTVPFVPSPAPASGLSLWLQMDCPKHAIEETYSNLALPVSLAPSLYNAFCLAPPTFLASNGPPNLRHPKTVPCRTRSRHPDCLERVPATLSFPAFPPHLPCIHFHLFSLCSFSSLLWIWMNADNESWLTMRWIRAYPKLISLNLLTSHLLYYKLETTYLRDKSLNLTL